MNSIRSSDMDAIAPDGTGHADMAASMPRAIDIGKGWRIANTDLAHFLKARETAPRSETSAPVSIRPDRKGDASP